MASNSFGKIFRITTFGESHGSAMGVVIDGCPAGLSLTENDINQFLELRRPSRTTLVSPRNEKDKAKILSGVFVNKTTGAPIAILIDNQSMDSSKYEATKDLLKPGHANYTYLKKYGIYDYRGSGRASARETVCRVAAGAVAQKILDHYNIETAAYLNSVGNITATADISNIAILRKKTLSNIIYCPDEKAATLMADIINQAKKEGDSIGGLVEFVIDGLPVGLGDPVYEKFSARLANAIFSIPAVKGFEIGEGFRVSQMRGSENNDLFVATENSRTDLASNYAGGILGGITTSKQVIGRVAFKPTSSIKKPQTTLNQMGKPQTLQLPDGSKHDPCVAIRAVMVVETMCILVTADALLMNRCAKID